MDDAIIAVECDFSTAESFWKFLEFSGVDLSASVFLNVEYQVYSDGAQIWLPPAFDDAYLKQLTEKKPVPEYMVLQLYPKSLTIGQTAAQMASIKTYQDYQDSDCQMIILAYDGLCAEVYCKNPAWLQTIIDHAVCLCGTKVIPKTALDDARTSMYL